MSINLNGWEQEIRKWVIAFAAALATSLALNAAQWLGAHIPLLIHYASTVIAAYTSLKRYS